jgi:hypothetical protein
MSPVTPVQAIEVSKIRFVQEAWPRRYRDEERVGDFAALYLQEGATGLPPLELVDEGNGRFLIADGVHRCEAARQAGLTHVLATLHIPASGADPAAVAYRRALECSAISSKPLTRAEKRAAIRRLLREQPEWSDRELARLVGVDHKTVGRVRKQLEVPTLLGDGEPPAFRAGPSPESLAKKLFQAFERTYEARGLGVLDFFTGDRTLEGIPCDNCHPDS